jgi:hypothetical protein
VPPGVVETHGLGVLDGDWAFVFKRTGGYNETYEELWAVRLDIPEPAQLAVRYQKPWGGAPEAIPPDPILRHLFAPDGRRVVLSGPNDELLVIDLENGARRSLGVSGMRPAWSKDGRWIAFTRLEHVPNPTQSAPLVDLEHRLWLVPSTGGAARRLEGMFADEWSPDGARLITHDPDGTIFLVDVVTGIRVARLGGLPAADAYAIWRRGSPGLALAVHHRLPGDRGYAAQVDVSDPPAGAVRPLAQAQTYGSEHFHTPRWNPMRNELMYLFGSPGGPPAVRTYDLSSGADRGVPIEVQHATWHPDGERVVYVPRIQYSASEVPGRLIPAAGPGLTIGRRDGSTERILMTADWQSETFLGIATVRY